MFHNISEADVAYFIYAPAIHRFFRGRCPKVAAIHAFVFAEELQHPEIQSMNMIAFARKFGLSRLASHLYFNSFIRKNLSCFDAVHVINKECLKASIHTKRVYYVPNWIDTSVFKPTEEKNERFSALFVGRRVKGYSTFVKVAELLKRQNIDFYAVGTDVESAGNVKSLGLVTNLTELVKLYSKVHVLIYPSQVDVFPLTLLEASACEVPVIALHTRAIEGLQLPLSYASSVRNFAEKVVELRNLWQKSEENYRRLVKQVRAASAKYDVQMVLPKYLRMLKEVAVCVN